MKILVEIEHCARFPFTIFQLRPKKAFQNHDAERYQESKEASEILAAQELSFPLLQGAFLCSSPF